MIINAFALMTSDNDFTPLVMRLLENGLPIYGFGEKKKPQPFVDACSTFIYTENLANEKQDKGSERPCAKKEKAQKKAKLRQDAVLVKLLRTAVEQTSGDGDWALMSNVGKYISNNSSFSPINYGYVKLGERIRATELFETEIRNEEKSLYIKDVRR